MKYKRRPSICIEIRVENLDIKIKDFYSNKCHKSKANNAARGSAESARSASALRSEQAGSQLLPPIQTHEHRGIRLFQPVVSEAPTLFSLFSSLSPLFPPCRI